MLSSYQHGPWHTMYVRGLLGSWHRKRCHKLGVSRWGGSGCLRSSKVLRCATMFGHVLDGNVAVRASLFVFDDELILRSSPDILKPTTTNRRLLTSSKPNNPAPVPSDSIAC